MKLTNEELLKMSDPSIPKATKDFICAQKMTPEELRVCTLTGVSPSDYMIQKSQE